VTPVIITILAWTGAFLSCLLTIPQAVRTLRSDRLDGLSAATYWIIFANAAAWAAWSALTGEYAAGVPALVNGPAALLILRRLHHSQRSVAPATHRQPSEPSLPLQPAPSLSVSACP
jgi:uncharacterized protein with PQ loop repeat